MSSQLKEKNVTTIINTLISVLARVLLGPLLFIHNLIFSWRRVLYIVAGVFVVPVVSAYCVIKEKESWPKKVYFFGSDLEDGLLGDRHGFYSNYLGKDFSELNGFGRWMIMLRWWMRNPCFNLRLNDKISVPITTPTNIVFKGNTYHHSIRYSFEPESRGLKWYRMSADYKGKNHTSTFLLLPLLGNEYLYIRYGLKIYPNLYFDPFWINKISAEGWPKHKKYGIYSSIIRTRNIEEL